MFWGDMRRLDKKFINLTNKLHLSTIRQLTSRDGFLSRTAEHLETGLVATLVGPEKKLFYASIGQMVLVVVGPDGVLKYRSPNTAEGEFARAAVPDIKPGSIIMVMHSSLADGLLPSLQLEGNQARTIAEYNTTISDYLEKLKAKKENSTAADFPTVLIAQVPFGHEAARARLGTTTSGSCLDQERAEAKDNSFWNNTGRARDLCRQEYPWRDTRWPSCV